MRLPRQSGAFLICGVAINFQLTRFDMEVSIFNVDSLSGGTEHGYARGKGNIYFAGDQTRHESRPAANQNGLRFDAVLSEDSLFLSDPEAERAAAERCGADLYTDRSRRAEHQAGRSRSVG